MLLLFILLRADRNRLPDIISLLSLIRKTRFSFLTVARFLFYFTWDVRFLFSFMVRAIFLSYTGGVRFYLVSRWCARFLFGYMWGARFYFISRLCAFSGDPSARIFRIAEMHKIFNRD